MKKIVIFTVTVLIIYFILGFIAAKNQWYDWFNLETYYSIGTIVGGAASVLGLLGLAYAKSTAKDLADIEAEYFRQVADLREELEKKERKVNTRTKDIELLEAKKEILELSIQRASRVLFAKTKKEEKEKEIISILSNEKRIIQLIEEIDELDNELKKLGEEIKSDKNVEIINGLLTKGGDLKKKQTPKINENLPSNPILASFVVVGRLLKTYVTSLVRILD